MCMHAGFFPTSRPPSKSRRNDLCTILKALSALMLSVSTRVGISPALHVFMLFTLCAQDNLEEMTTGASNIVFLLMWPIFNVLLVTVHFRIVLCLHKCRCCHCQTLGMMHLLSHSILMFLLSIPSALSQGFVYLGRP